MAISFSADDRARLAAVAVSINVPLNCLLAVIEVESGGKVFATINGEKKPLIRFEGHYFDRLCADSVRAKAREQGISSPVAGAVKNPASQAARWRLLERAAKLDRQAAYESCSWGVGQVMGAHWKALGYSSVLALVDEACSGLAGQAMLMAKFIKHNGLDDELRQHDWAGFARGYNGPAFARYGYDRKLASAYRRLTSGSPSTRQIQELLTAAGFPVAIDGIRGAETQAAIKAFQQARKLDVDGIVGPETWAALTARKDPAAGADPRPFAPVPVAVSKDHAIGALAVAAVAAVAHWFEPIVHFVRGLFQ